MEDSDLRHAYAALDLSPPVTEDDLKHRYKALVRRWHPDRYQSDPVGQTEATERLRNINVAYDLVSASLAHPEPLPEDVLPEDPSPEEPIQEVVTPTYSTERQFSWSPERVDAMVDSINRINSWPTEPEMSAHRWLSLGALFGYVVLAGRILVIFRREPSVVAFAGVASIYFWIAMYLIWRGDDDSLSDQQRVLYRLIGWVVMALPINVGVALWLALLILL